MVTIRHKKNMMAITNTHAISLVTAMISSRGSVLPMGGLIDGKGLGCVSPHADAEAYLPPSIR